MLVLVAGCWEQLATTEDGAEENDRIEADGLELQGPGGAKHFTIDDDDDGVGASFRNGGARPALIGGGVSAPQEAEADEDEDDDAREDGQDEEGVVYSLTNFEPQRHTDMT